MSGPRHRHGDPLRVQLADDRQPSNCRACYISPVVTLPPSVKSNPTSGPGREWIVECPYCFEFVSADNRATAVALWNATKAKVESPDPLALV